MSDEAITLTSKQFKTIIAGIVSGVLLVGGVGGSGVLRLDKFTGKDAEILRRDIESNEDRRHIEITRRILTLELNQMHCMAQMRDLGMSNHRTQ